MFPVEHSDKYERAFNARLAYEKNCIAKYDYPDWMHKPSKPPIKGERMEDFARKFGTTIREMEDCEIQVDRALQNELSDAIRDIVTNSACDFEQALRLLKKSKDYNRDVELIKKLKNCGISEKLVNVFISAIND